jgi:hypothetical protein
VLLTGPFGGLTDGVGHRWPSMLAAAMSGPEPPPFLASAAANRARARGRPADAPLPAGPLSQVVGSVPANSDPEEKGGSRWGGRRW